MRVASVGAYPLVSLGGGVPLANCPLDVVELRRVDARQIPPLEERFEQSEAQARCVILNREEKSDVD